MNATKVNAMQKCQWVLLALALVVFSCNEKAKPKQRLSREEAKKILEAIGYENIAIGAIVQDAVDFKVMGVGGNNTASVIALGRYGAFNNKRLK